MSTHSGLSPTTNTSVVRNTVGRGKEKSQENPNEPASNAALREFCDKNYNQLLPILAEKMHQEKVQQEKLKAVKARLNFEETSQHSESGAPSRIRDVGIKRRYSAYLPVSIKASVISRTRRHRKLYRVPAPQRNDSSPLPKGIMIERAYSHREEGMSEREDQCMRILEI
ncbi:hypothetical protein Tco_0414568 [Tanacetum coccineum]